jgi:hypothetical protein
VSGSRETRRDARAGEGPSTTGRELPPMPKEPRNRSTIMVAAIIFGLAVISALVLPPLR